MEIRLVDNVKRSVCFICILNCFGNISSSQSCQDAGGKTLMKWQELLESSNNATSSGAIFSSANTDLRSNLTSYLSQCSFTSQPSATSFGMCSALCAQDADCMAMFVDSDNACELCLATACDVDGNGNDYDVNKTMIAVETFADFIDNNGKRHLTIILRIIFQINACSTHKL